MGYLPPMRRPIPPAPIRRCAYCGNPSKLDRCQSCGSHEFTGPSLANSHQHSLRQLEADLVMVSHGFKSADQVRAELGCLDKGVE